VRKSSRSASTGARVAVSPEESHVGSGKGLQALVESFEGAFATDSVAKKHGDKVDHLIVPETATGKADALGKGVKDSKLLQITDDEDGLPEPGWR
jgi:hypothetical protein